MNTLIFSIVAATLVVACLLLRQGQALQLQIFLFVYEACNIYNAENLFIVSIVFSKLVLSKESQSQHTNILPTCFFLSSN
jgi:hypothetical protein